MKTWEKVFMHALELGIVVIASFAIMNIFNLTGENATAVFVISLGALTKFVRESAAIPIRDYVNKSTDDNEK